MTFSYKSTQIVVQTLTCLFPIRIVSHNSPQPDHNLFTGDCAEPGGVPFANRTLYNGPYLNGARITYTCFNGSTATISCHHDSREWTWTPKPNCFGETFSVHVLSITNLLKEKIQICNVNFPCLIAITEHGVVKISETPLKSSPHHHQTQKPQRSLVRSEDPHTHYTHTAHTHRMHNIHTHTHTILIQIPKHTHHKPTQENIIELPIFQIL